MSPCSQGSEAPRPGAQGAIHYLSPMFNNCGYAPGPANYYHNAFSLMSGVLYPMSLLWTVRAGVSPGAVCGAVCDGRAGPGSPCPMSLSLSNSLCALCFAATLWPCDA